MNGYTEDAYFSREGIAIELGDWVSASPAGRVLGVVRRYESGGYVRFEKKSGDEITVSASVLSIRFRPEPRLDRALIAAEMAIHRALALATTDANASISDALHTIDEELRRLRALADTPTTP